MTVMSRKTKRASEETVTRATAPFANASEKRHNKAASQAVSQPVSQPETAGEPSRSVSYEDIARLAFSYWEQRGYQNGSPDADWLRAEQELLSTR